MSEGRLKTQSLLRQTKDLLQSHDLRAKKGLGQHFLINSGILRNIAAAADLSPSDIVLEIGPGLGVLTRQLAAQAGWVIAVELDTRLSTVLQETLSGCANVSIINQDILELEPLDLLQQESTKFPSEIIDARRYKLVANLPYYITAPIIRHFCEARLRPQTMVIMVQKEVAKNIVARPGDLSILAISVQYYGKPEIAGYVPAANFFPAPKIDSAILKITLHPAPAVQTTSDARFFEIVRAGFCAARKQLANSLAQGLAIPKAEVLSLMDRGGVAAQKRAEDLSLEEWAGLERTFSEAGKLR